MKKPQINENLRDIILGGQDGLVNVLGIVLGVAAGTNELRLIIISGLAATFAESISMAAVAFTSTQAESEKYQSIYKKQQNFITANPESETSDVKTVFKKWGFEGALLDEATKKITSNKESWIKFLMSEELDLAKINKEKPFYTALVVGLAAFAGSLIPLLPFFILQDIKFAVFLSVGISSLVLFVGGFIKAKVTIGGPIKSGLELLVIGITSAIAGFGIGSLLGTMPK